MIKLLTGKEPANEMLTMNRRRVEQLKERTNIIPRLDVIRVGNNPASERYVRNKQKDADNVGIQCVVHHFGEMEAYNLTQCEFDKIRAVIRQCALDSNCHGIILQLPFESKDIENRLINEIPIEKDVDGLTAGSIGARTINANSAFWPCTPEGIIELLCYYRIPIAGRNVAVVGRSNLVGQPLAQMFTNEDATVTLYHSKSDMFEMNLSLPEYDIVCLCTGRGHQFDVNTLVDSDTYPSNQHVIIDVGISFDKNSHMIGDFNPADLKPTDDVSYTPVPGGIGLMTRAVLMKHVVDAAERSVVIT